MPSGASLTPGIESVQGGLGSVLPSELVGGMSNIPGLGFLGPVLQTALGAVGKVASIPGQAVQTVAGIPGQLLGGGGNGDGPVDLTGWSGGNGRYVTRTTVETMDTQSGEIVKIRREPGQPYMMNKDVQAMRRVLRKAGKLQKRIPRKTRKQSKSEQLKDAAVDVALQNVRMLPAPHNHD